MNIIKLLLSSPIISTNRRSTSSTTTLPLYPSYLFHPHKQEEGQWLLTIILCIVSQHQMKNHICLSILIPPVKSISQFIYPIPIPINDPRPIVTILLKLPPYSWLHSASTTSKTSNNHMEFKLKIKSPTHLYPLPAQSPSPSPLQAIYCMQGVNSELFTSTCFDIIQVISWSYNSPTCPYTQLYVIIFHTTRIWELQQICEEKLLQEKSKIHSLSHVTWHKAN